MRSPMLVRKEYKNVCREMDNLLKKAGSHTPLPEDTSERMTAELSPKQKQQRTNRRFSQGRLKYSGPSSGQIL
jgi:hypothetical protein